VKPDIVQLGPTEIIAEHPFTHPDHTPVEFDVLRYMVNRLCPVLEDDHLCSFMPKPIMARDPNGKHYRMVVTNPKRLLALENLPVVGFFGQKRTKQKTTALMKADKLLKQEMLHHPDLLCYCTLALTNDEFGNLVIFASEEAKTQWNRSKAHREVVDMAPRHYLSIRLYNGRLPGGVLASETLYPTRIIYLDFQSKSTWRAIRDL
jgi:hypothetical protein